MSLSESLSPLARSQLLLTSALLLPSTLLLPLPVPLPVVEDPPPLPMLLIMSSSRLEPRRCCKAVLVPGAGAASRNTLPIPSKKPVIVRTSSSLTRKQSLKSIPTSFHRAAISIASDSSATSESICRSRARLVFVRSIPFTCSENRTILCALR